MRIITPSRLHITLIDLNASIGRVDGGIGLTLHEPSIEISAEGYDTLEITGRSEHEERMRNAVKKILPKEKGIRIRIERDYPSHVGLGSGTQASLAAGMAANLLYNLNMSVYEIAKKVGRGGTSGIGVAAFEKGGFILDGGHRFSDKKDFLPSSATKLPPAPVLLRKDFPDWKILVAIPETKGAHMQREVDIFKKICPIPLKEVEKLSHIILMQILPALIEEDIITFGRGINAIQNIGFKRKEVELQPKAKKLMEMLVQEGAYGAGMSSFGPTVYAFGEDMENLKSMAEEFLEGKGKVYITKARNTGAIVQW